jgi:anthranilate/para-aminobenzoate synthase component I
MTGAPKLRAIEHLRTLEAGPRGAYAGAFGYFAPDGSAELAVTIRTLICDGPEVSFGVGGAILLDSDPQAEWEETELKAAALLAALGLGG